MTEPLPNFASDWMAQWKRAAKELSRIRTAELRQLQPSVPVDAMALLDVAPSPSFNPHDNGLVIQQKWFMRQRLLELLTEEVDTCGPAQASKIGD